MRKALVKWRASQFNLYPKLRDQITSVDPLKPEEEELLLPSSFSQPMRSALGLDDLAKTEFALREGQAHDALESVRLSIKTFNHNLQYKAKNIHGQGPNTRAQAFLSTLSADKISAADNYRRARSALLALDLPEDDPTLRPLFDNQLWMTNISQPMQLGDSKKEDPWFWSVGRPRGLSEAEEKDWSIERMLMSIFSHLFINQN